MLTVERYYSFGNMQSFFLIFLHIPKIHPIPIPIQIFLQIAYLLSPIPSHAHSSCASCGPSSCVWDASLIHHAHHGPNPSCSSWAILILIPSIPMNPHPMGHPHPLHPMGRWHPPPGHRFGGRLMGGGGLGVCVQIIQKGPSAFEVPPNS